MGDSRILTVEVSSLVSNVVKDQSGSVVAFRYRLRDLSVCMFPYHVLKPQLLP